jgi:putrescine---pyruvate transaminase
MTNTYQHLQQLDAAHHIHPFNDNAELAKKGTRILTKGEGCYVWDAEGNKLLDAFAGLCCGQADGAIGVLQHLLSMHH